MVIRLQGGLGNQMFQYAYGITKDKNLKVDIGLLASGKPPREPEIAGYAKLDVVDDPAGETGYWQEERFFDKELVSKLYRAAPYVHESAFMGVRRADYLWPERINYHGVMPLEYYREAVKLLPKHVGILVFTDDEPWARKNFPYPTCTLKGPTAIKMMSRFRYAIIANSTFHWWGAWLGADRHGGKVIAPKKWLLNEPWPIVPERWITL